jgi:hypothetical protein
MSNKMTLRFVLSSALILLIWLSFRVAADEPRTEAKPISIAYAYTKTFSNFTDAITLNLKYDRKSGRLWGESRSTQLKDVDSISAYPCVSSKDKTEFLAFLLGTGESYPRPTTIRLEDGKFVSMEMVLLETMGRTIYKN